MQTLIPKSEVNIDLVQKIFEAAMYPVERDDDELTVLVPPVRVLFGLPNDSTLLMRVMFRIDEEHSAQVLYEACNSFNSGFLIAKAYFDAEYRVLAFESDINFEGGLTPVNLATRVRRLASVIQHDHILDPYIQ